MTRNRNGLRGTGEAKQAGSSLKRRREARKQSADPHLNSAASARAGHCGRVGVSQEDASGDASGEFFNPTVPKFHSSTVAGGPETGRADPGEIGLEGRLRQQAAAVQALLTRPPPPPPPPAPTASPRPLRAPAVHLPSIPLDAAGPATSALSLRQPAGPLVAAAEVRRDFRGGVWEVDELIDQSPYGRRRTAPRGGWLRWAHRQEKALEALDDPEAMRTELENCVARLQAQGAAEGQGGLLVDRPAPCLADQAEAEKAAGLCPHAGWRPLSGYAPVDTSAVDALRPLHHRLRIAAFGRFDRVQAQRVARREAARTAAREAARREEAEEEGFDYGEHMREQAAIKALIRIRKRRNARAAACRDA